MDLGLTLGTLQPLVLGPTTVPVVLDPSMAEREVELAVLSAMIHGNGSQGLAVVQNALVALGRLDHEHSAVYFQVIWDVLRAPMQRALEAMAMEGQTEGKATFPPFAQRIFERGGSPRTPTKYSSLSSRVAGVPPATATVPGPRWWWRPRFAG